MHEVLANIHEQLQFQAYLQGQASFTDKHHKKGPAPKPEHYPRTAELFGPVPVPRPAIDDDDDEDEWVQPPREDEDEVNGNDH